MNREQQEGPRNEVLEREIEVRDNIHLIGPEFAFAMNRLSKEESGAVMTWLSEINEDANKLLEKIKSAGAENTSEQAEE